MWRSTVYCILDQNLPSIGRLLKGVQIECDQVVEEEPFDLSTKDVDLTAEDVQSVTITPWWSWTCG